MTVDHYAGAAQGWADGASIVYGPIARELVALAPAGFAGRTVLDAGAGTGAASQALRDQGARVLATDLSGPMLAWKATDRPPAATADITALPLASDSVDDAVAAFVLNHLPDPRAALRELVRVTRPGGAVLACVFSTEGLHPAREVLDDAARAEGWVPPPWYLDLKNRTAPIVGSPAGLARAARSAGLTAVRAEERPVEVGVDAPEQLVDYRLGQAHFAGWLAQLGPERAAVRARLVEQVRPVMAPYRPVVVFLAAEVPPGPRVRSGAPKEQP